MCIDYRFENGLLKRSCYPLPLIDDFLIGFEELMWFVSLDMTSSFWATSVCPFRQFQWVRLPFGLKRSAHLRICDQQLLIGEIAERNVPILTKTMTVFKRYIPAPPQMGPVLGRSSYIDDIAHGAATWDHLCDDLNELLYRLRYWNISVILRKSEFGKLVIPYLSHEISAEGIRADPKIVNGVQALPFPATLKGVFLNYYHNCFEDLPVIAAPLYELTEEWIRSGRDLLRAKEAFEILKLKIVSTPRPFVIIPHPNQWAAFAVLGQVYDGTILPVRFTGRVLNYSELRYHSAKKDVIPIFRVLQDFRTMLEGCLYIHQVLRSKMGPHFENRPRTMRTLKVQRDKDGLPAIMGAGITPREHLDKVAESLILTKAHTRAHPVVSMAMLGSDYAGIVIRFDRAAKTPTKKGSCGCILWKLPEWRVIQARCFTLKDVTVNNAEYQGLRNGLVMSSERNVEDLVVVRDSRIVIQQVQGLINCHQPNLLHRLTECQTLKEKFRTVRLVHVKREYNQSADYLTSKTLR
ncbi:reverse transcriptase [Phytophthora megakarya]|uniref:Reverse transcriptase n=1 Tax=Phytophthora megakarya TaxID=4795 RepID=A0A225WDQ1_9STRA|nr:reverse transcriptase [Phytophthora megakarya]